MTTAPPGSFVGRGPERRELARLLDRAATAAVGGFALVSGDPGIGKTALVEQVASEARTAGFDLGWASCWQTAAVSPLRPWVQLMTQLADPDAGIPDLSIPGDLDTLHTGRLEQARRVGTWVRTRSHRPTLLVIDDLHWADTATLSVLAHVVSGVRALPVVVITTHRSAEPTAAPAFDRTVAELGRHGLTLPLAGLDAEATAELVVATTGHAPSDSAARSLVQLTGGNPLLTRELSRTLTADALGGPLDPAGLVVPRTVRSIVLDRMAGLSPSCRSLLELLSVAGDETTYDTLAVLAGVGTPALLELLDEGARACLVDAGHHSVAFPHALFRAAVYDSLTAARRLHLHDEVGRALLARRERGHAVDVAALAHHFGRSAPLGNTGRAFAFALDAAREAVEKLAFDVAAQRYEQALAVLALDPSLGSRPDLLLDLADARLAVGDRDGARRLFGDAAAEAQRQGDPIAFGRAALGVSGGMGGIEVVVGDPEVCALLETAAGRLRDDDVLGARIEARRSIALSRSAPPEERARIATAARDRAVRGGDPSTIAEALAAWCDVVAGPERLHDRRSAAMAIIGYAADAGDVRVEALGRRHLVEALLEGGELDAAVAEVGRFEVTASRLGRAEYGWYPPLWRAALALARADLDGRRRHHARLQELVEETGSTNAALLALVHDSTVAFDLGDAAAARRCLDQVEAQGRLVEDVQLQISVARLLDVVGEHERAGALLEQWADRALDADTDAEWAPMMLQLGELIVRRGGHPAADRVRARIEPYGAVWAVEGIGAGVRGPLDRILGALAALAGDRDGAVRHFDAARRAAERAGAHHVTALVDRDRTALLGHPSGDRSGADRSNRWVADGDVWTLTFAGRTVTMTDRKGLRDLGRLLAEPGRELAALDLVTPGHAVIEGDTGAPLDRRARDAYRARLVELEAELDEADRHADSGRSARLTVERDALVAELTAAYGLGGRARRPGRSAERARTAVRSRISDAIERVEAVHPALGRHLARSVRTGTFCVYDPDPPVGWVTASHTVRSDLTPPG